MEYDIFISYSRADHAIVDTFVRRLESAGYKVWIDQTGINKGTLFKSVIVKAIEDSRVFLFFSSENANASPYTAKEIAIAVDRQKIIIPVKLDSTRYDPDVEFDLLGLDFVDYRNKSNHDHEFEKLKRSLETVFASEQNYPQKKINVAGEKRKNGIKNFSILKNLRGWVIFLSLISLLAIIGIPLFFFTYHNYGDSKSQLPSASADSIEISLPVNGTSKFDAPQLIDLGLPSGTLWADRNIGALYPEDYGLYFAWGEIEDKEEYTEDTYFNKEKSFYIDQEWEIKIIAKEISGTKYDAATVQLGTNYRMPTKDDMNELIHFCEWKYKEFDGIYGYEFGYEITGPNGRSIFLPNCGYKSVSMLIYQGSYWTSTVSNGDVNSLDFDEEGYELCPISSIYFGLPIRPVSK